MDNSIASKYKQTPRMETPASSIASRRASCFPQSELSRSAPDAPTLAQLTPFRRGSLPASPSCSSVGTQTPTDIVHFEFPESFDEDCPDGSKECQTMNDSWTNKLEIQMDWKSAVFKGSGLHRRVSFTEVAEAKMQVQGVGEQLRSIGDDFERNRTGTGTGFTSGLSRSRSLSWILQRGR